MPVREETLKDFLGSANFEYPAFCPSNSPLKPPSPKTCSDVMAMFLVKLLYFGMACHYSIAPWYPPYQPFSGIDRAMASWHGRRDENLISPKLKVKKSVLAFVFIWVRALRLIFSQVYITRPSLSFFRPPNFSRILCF